MKSTIITVYMVLMGLFCPLTIHAQDLHVYYDFFTDEVLYKIEGKTVEKPKIRKGGQIYIHVTELNNYLYRVETEVVQANDAVTEEGGLAGNPFQNLMPSSGMPASFDNEGNESFDPGSGGLTSLQIAELPLFTIGDKKIMLQDFFTGSRGSAEIVAQAESLSSELTQLTNELALMSKEVQAIDKSIQVSTLAAGQVQELKFNPHLKPSAIKRMSMEYYQALFRKQAGQTIALDDVLRLQNEAEEAEQLVAEMKNKQRVFTAKSNGLAEIARQFNDLNTGETTVADLAKNLTAVSKQAKETETQVDVYLSKRNKKAKAGMTLAEAARFQVGFEELQSNDFTYTSGTTVEKDEVVVTAKIHLKGEAKKEVEGEDDEAVKTKTFYFKSKGGMRVNASAGINFGQHFTAAQNFSVQNDVIVAEDDGAFNPSVVSYLHFYPNMGKSGAVLGGAFGIGLPVLNGENAGGAVSFYLGPSLVLGSGRRVIFTGGIMGARTKRLARGFQPGDAFDLQLGDIPTRNPFELGYFLGISFNVAGG